MPLALTDHAGNSTAGIHLHGLAHALRCLGRLSGRPSASCDGGALVGCRPTLQNRSRAWATVCHAPEESAQDGTSLLHSTTTTERLCCRLRSRADGDVACATYLPRAGETVCLWGRVSGVPVQSDTWRAIRTPVPRIMYVRCTLQPASQRNRAKHTSMLCIKAMPATVADARLCGRDIELPQRGLVHLQLQQPL